MKKEKLALVASVCLVIGCIALTNAQVTQQPGTWVNVLPAAQSGATYSSTVAIDQARKSDIYLFADDIGCWRSTDYGTTWKKVSAKGGLNGTGISGHGAWYASIDKNPNRDPSTPPDLYAAAGYAENGIWKSTDWGVTWYDVWSNNLYAADGVTNIYSDVGRDVMAILNTDPGDKNHLIASPHSYWGSQGNNGVFESTDGGGKWIIRKSSYFSFAPHADMLFSLDANTWCVSHGNTIIRTTDAGRTWGPTTGSVSGSTGIQYCNRKVGNTWYVATDHTGHLSKTTDMGATWQSTGLNAERTEWVLASATKLYAASAYDWDPVEVFEASIDNDRTWTKQTGTPSTGGHDADMTFDGTHYLIIFPAHKSGVWRYVEPSTTTIAKQVSFPKGSSISKTTKIQISLHSQTTGLKGGDVFGIRGERIRNRNASSQAVIVRVR